MIFYKSFTVLLCLILNEVSSKENERGTKINGEVSKEIVLEIEVEKNFNQIIVIAQEERNNDLRYGVKFPINIVTDSVDNTSNSDLVIPPNSDVDAEFILNNALNILADEHNSYLTGNLIHNHQQDFNLITKTYNNDPYAYITRSRDLLSPVLETSNINTKSGVHANILRIGEQDCELWSTWTMNCYDCKCNEDSKSECVRKGHCLPPPSHEPKLCKPYTWFYLDNSSCQKCECNGDGIPVCTFNYYDCSKKTHYKFYHDTNYVPKYNPKDCSVNRLSHIKPLRICKPNTEWTARCHHCKCDEDGQPTCSKVTPCEPPLYGAPARCKPGTLPEVSGCMNCICNDDGDIQAQILR